MSASFDRFLNARRQVSRKASLGRAFTVTRQSWRLTDDPRTTPPEVEVLATRRTASEAADPSGFTRAWGAALVLFAFILITNVGARALLARSRAGKLQR